MWDFYKKNRGGLISYQCISKVFANDWENTSSVYNFLSLPKMMLSTWEEMYQSSNVLYSTLNFTLNIDKTIT